MSEQDEVVRLLSDPRTFGAHAVELVETHRSLVFLAGERSYKLKRAVRYSYLDYSTEARRRAACEAEHALNRQFAPGLYLGVTAVVRDEAGALQLGGEGAPVDWVVEMRRFRQADQFDEMATRGALTPALMRSLADRVADAHLAAEPRPDRVARRGLGGGWKTVGDPAAGVGECSAEAVAELGGAGADGALSADRVAGAPARCGQGSRVSWRPAPAEYLPSRRVRPAVRVEFAGIYLDRRAV